MYRSSSGGKGKEKEKVKEQPMRAPGHQSPSSSATRCLFSSLHWTAGAGEGKNSVAPCTIFISIFPLVHRLRDFDTEKMASEDIVELLSLLRGDAKGVRSTGALQRVLDSLLVAPRLCVHAECEQALAPGE